MHLVLTNAPLITADGIQTTPLFIDTRTGRILSAEQIYQPVEIKLDGYMLLPGLINAHDHLELNHFPRTKFRDVYTNAHVWGEDVSARLDDSPFWELRSYPLWDRCFIGGLKNLLAGVTTVAHHNHLYRPLRSPYFPVNVVQHYGWAHSLHFGSPSQIQKSYRKTPRDAPWIIHLAEGTDKVAADELRRLEALGVLGSNTVLVHGVGMTQDDMQKAIGYGAGLIWCPSTNRYLLGQTGKVDSWIVAGRLALGSDSRLTADGDLLDELRAGQASGQVDEKTLFCLVTEKASRLLQLESVGRLAAGMWADVIALPASDEPYRALVNARRHELAFVMRRGKMMLGEPEIVARVQPGAFMPVRVNDRVKSMVAWLVDQIKRCKLVEPGLKIAA